MVELIEWPTDFLRWTYGRLFIKNTSRSAGVAMNGVRQIIAPKTQVWNLSITIPVDGDETRIKQFEALVSEMDGQYNVANVPIVDRYRYGVDVAPWQYPFDDGQWFDDGTGYSDGTGGTQPLVTSAPASAGDTSLYVDLTNPVRPSMRVGDTFSRSGFLYRVVARNNAGWMKLKPALRADIPAGATLITNPPRFYCRFASDEEGARGRDAMSFGESITLNLVEAFDRSFT